MNSKLHVIALAAGLIIAADTSAEESTQPLFQPGAYLQADFGDSRRFSDSVHFGLQFGYNRERLRELSLGRYPDTATLQTRAQWSVSDRPLPAAPIRLDFRPTAFTGLYLAGVQLPLRGSHMQDTGGGTALTPGQWVLVGVACVATVGIVVAVSSHHGGGGGSSGGGY